MGGRERERNACIRGGGIGAGARAVWVGERLLPHRLHS